MSNITIGNLFDLTNTIAAPVFEGCEYPWEVLPKIGEFIVKLGETLPEDEYKDLTLADIYHYEDKNVESVTKKKKIGF